MKKLTWGSAVVLGLGSLALAADRHYVPMAPDSVRSHAQPSQYAAPARGPGILIRATQILGERVQDAQGEQIGQIREMVMDGRRKRITLAAITLSDGPNASSKHYAVPWTAMTNQTSTGSPADDSAFTLQVDKDRLKGAPGFDAARWPDLADQRWSREVGNFYGQARPEMGAQPTLQGEPISDDAGRKRDKASRSKGSSSSQPLMLKVNAEMIGHRVRHAWNNELIGEVNDLIVDRRTGDVAFIVLHLDPGTSVTQSQAQKDYVALPVAMFLLDRSKDAGSPFTVECCLEKLKTHRFSGETWPDLASRSWVTSLYDDFGRTPYWEQR